MDYRLCSRLLASFYLMISIFVLFIIIGQGTALLNYNILDHSEKSIIGVLLFLFCLYSSVSNIKLLTATGTQVVIAEDAFKLCKFWWIWAWTAMGVGGLLLLYHIMILSTHFNSLNFQLHRAIADPNNWIFWSEITFFILHVYGISWVYKYMEEISGLLNNQGTTDSMTNLVVHIEDSNFANLIHFEPPPTYNDSVKSTEIYVPPPSYESVAQTNKFPQ